MKIKNYIAVLFFITAGIFAQEMSQTFISLKNTGVEEFLKKHPEYDGRGAIIMVLDTGVDGGIDGLKKTSTGETKVIDVQDFTGEGDVKLQRAEIDDEDGKYFFESEDESIKVFGADKLGLKSVNDEYWIGVITEKLWLNSSAGTTDVNGNGTENDKFVLVAFETSKDSSNYWVVYFDTNSDGDLSDEKPLRDYKVNQDSFIIPNDSGLPNFLFGINIFPDEKRVSIHYDDGAHGTHCAGIAAGNSIGDSLFHGVAPGAYVMSLKLGNNNFSGGATVSESMKKAYLYADKISKEREEPCIINMSFGIGSEIEGRADMEIFLDELVKNNPYLYISTSNGNEGPGISTTGLPSASSSVFSSGAVLAQEVGNDLYGAPLTRDIILHFSSRGGEVSKPDVVSPGAATSTVPNWTMGDRFWGTSMASPYSAGVMSLLLSAMKAEFPDVKIPSLLLYKVLRESAVPMEGYTRLDQGGGLINVMNAYALLKKYIKSGELKKFETYTVKAFAPNMPDGFAPNLYIRNGSYLTGNETFTFRIFRNNFINKNKFYRIFELKSDAEWLKPIQKSTYIRNNQQAIVNFKIDRELLDQPGLYNAKITAFRKGTKIPEFDMMATVVIPQDFNAANEYRMDYHFDKLEPGMHRRIFLNIPAGASAMKVEMESPNNTYSQAWYFLHEPDGRKLGINFLNSEREENRVESFYYNIEPGVYELDIFGYYRAKNVSTFDVKVEFAGIDRLGDKDLTLNENNIEVINQFSFPKKYSLSGKLLGYEKEYRIELENKDTYNIPFVLLKNESEKSFEVKISKEDFNKTTDFAVQIYDEDGVSISKTGLSYQSESISVRNHFDKDSLNLRLELRPAFANAPGEMIVYVTERGFFKNTVDLNVSAGGRNSTVFYPSIKKTLKVEFSKPDAKIPVGAKAFGEVYFKNKDNTEVEIPLYFKF